MSRLDDLLIASPSLEGMRSALQRAAASKAAILLVGESGSGRTSLARALHQESPRAAAPLVEVDPGVVPSTLFESEFFGHLAGSFTGAESHHEGRVAAAEGGTLLLDPVEELPLEAQPKLLRLLAERCYSPLGGRERTADVRFVTVGSEELPQRVQRGAFREDLFFRLEVLAFRLPPLRERLSDLPTLLDSVLTDLARRYGRGRLEVSERARAWMEKYGWPGNLRELRNVLERELVLHDAGVLDPDPPSGSGTERPPSLEEVEKRAIVAALRYTRGHQGRAADILGISRKSLWEKRKRYGLP